MFVRRSLIVAALAISVARCTDQSTAPHPAAFQLLDWADTTALFSASASQPSAPGVAATYMGPPAPLELDKKRVTFWAVRGASRSVQINYRGKRDSEPHPFLLLTTTDPQFVPGLGELAVGDSVLVTVTVDTRKLKVSLEPTGLQFGAPATLTLWYTGAADDPKIGDAPDDSLGLFYRENHKDPWVQIAATQSREQKSFTSNIPHFSFYAVARLMEWSVGW
jgi:hypothetical protein